jgi:DNA-binding GntR family transcriptional regulator
MTNADSRRFPALIDTILHKLHERPYSPVELLQEFQSAQVSESAVKDALATLMDEHIIELSPDRRITIRELQASRGVRKAG